jgi:EpsD family peptidyl-prolyl cis-trans isomerase
MSSQWDSIDTYKCGRFLVAGVQVAALALALAACKPGGPSGQVVATVNGKEITTQDLLSQARANGNARQDPRAVLEEVIARVLLSQSAHTQKLDAYPGYPSDLVRLQQSFLAEKALQQMVKPGAPPTPAEIAAFEAAHPYLFASRAKLQVNEIRFETADNMKSLQGADNLAGVISKLKSVNTPFDQKSQTLDTAQMPTELAAHLVTVPLNQLQFFREGNVVLGIVVVQRDPIVPSPEQQSAIAGELLVKSGAQNQVKAAVAQLRAKSSIVYQKGYGPGAPAPAAAPKPK